MVEIQRAGIANGPGPTHKGRPPSIDTDEVQRLKATGKGGTEIAKALGIGRASVYRAAGSVA
jgi:DNA invertase Pin-like site-specific DNA recombinase